VAQSSYVVSPAVFLDRSKAQIGYVVSPLPAVFRDRSVAQSVQGRPGVLQEHLGARAFQELKGSHLQFSSIVLWLR
jgi:hypothetical protein